MRENACWDTKVESRSDSNQHEKKISSASIGVFRGNVMKRQAG